MRALDLTRQTRFSSRQTQEPAQRRRRNARRSGATFSMVRNAFQRMRPFFSGAFFRILFLYAMDRPEKSASRFCSFFFF